MLQPSVCLANDFVAPFPLPIKGDANIRTLQNIQLLPSHQKAVQHVLVGGPGGFAEIQGPPGSGKTTLAGKLAYICYDQVNLGQQKIVLTAHANHAVRVLTESVAKQFEARGLQAADHVVYVQTAASREREVVRGERLPDWLAKLTIDAHCTRIAEADQATYDLFLAGLATGYVFPSKSDEELWSKQRRRLIELVKEHRPVFCCSLSTCNTNYF